MVPHTETTTSTTQAETRGPERSLNGLLGTWDWGGGVGRSSQVRLSRVTKACLRVPTILKNKPYEDTTSLFRKAKK